ncbi:MAG: galactokinase family protein [Bacteroidales bacterium]
MGTSEQLVGAGMSGRAAEDKACLFARGWAALGGVAGSEGSFGLYVPGRIEVLGKHTDYAGGRSLLCAAERGMCLVARPRPDNRVVVTDVANGSRVETLLDSHTAANGAGWSVYVTTAARRLARNFPFARLGADIVFGSDLPAAAGMSSSSALLTSIALALIEVNALATSETYRREIRSREDLAEYLGTVENGRDFRTLAGDAGVGTFGGSEDHTAMLCCRAGHLSQYSFCPVRREGEVALPDGYEFVVGVSGVAAEKTGAARTIYNQASLLAHRVLELWQARTGRTERSLAAAVGKWGLEEFAFLRAVEPALADRFDQFCRETFEIIPAVVLALADGQVGEVGDLVDRSQQEAERALGNQVPETVFLARSARQGGAVAASAFGAGFGGSVWALVDSSEAAAFTRRWQAAYEAEFPARAAGAQFFRTLPGPAAMRL